MPNMVEFIQCNNIYRVFINFIFRSSLITHELQISIGFILKIIHWSILDKWEATFYKSSSFTDELRAHSNREKIDLLGSVCVPMGRDRPRPEQKKCSRSLLFFYPSFSRISLLDISRLLACTWKWQEVQVRRLNL